MCTAHGLQSTSNSKRRMDWRKSAIIGVLSAACVLAVPATRPAEKSVRETVQILTGQGNAALAAMEAQASLDAYLDAMLLLKSDKSIPLTDSVRVDTLHGLAIAYLRAGKFDKAGEIFKSGEVLDKVFVARTATRSMVINRAVLDLTQKFNVMRTVKTCNEYLAAQPDTTDETVLNLLGTALDRAADDSRFVTAPLFVQAAKFYETAVAKLESNRPGEKRWGVTWVNEKEFEKLQKDRQLALDEITAAADALAMARSRERAAGAEVVRQRKLRSVGRGDNLSGAIVAQRQAEQAVTEAERSVAQARARLPKLPWVQNPEPVLPDGSDVVTVAIASNSKPPHVEVIEPTKPTRKPPRAKPARSETPPATPPGSADPQTGQQPGSETPASESPLTGTPVTAVSSPEPVVDRTPSRVTRYAAAFPVATDLLVTTRAAVEKTDSVTLEDSQGNSFTASVVRTDDKTGLALIRVSGQRFAFLKLADTFAGGGEVRCTGFPRVAIFNPTPESIVGRSAAIKAGGDWTISLPTNPRLGGAPIVSAQGEVVGVVMAQRDSNPQQLPSIPLDDLKTFLGTDLPKTPTSAANPMYVLQLTAVVSK